ncbi:MAG: tRNA 2-thiouridine(34) synthase MnmA [Candidatus Methanosuratincola sp.]
MARRRVLVAMSGGVDSSTAAAILARQGHEVIGVTMQLWDYGEAGSGCCTLDDVADARRVARHIGIPHYVVNYMDVFRKFVVEDFIDKYFSGRTPNPCILCNQFVKFTFLLRRSLELEADFLATGHYARVVRDEATGFLYLGKALDNARDQSYFLFTLTQRELERLVFPLGELRKEEVRAIARELGLRVAEKPDSQEICFVRGDYREFLKTKAPIDSERGRIVDMEGRVLGTHSGVHLFTVGQRRGLGLGGDGRRLYVIKIDHSTNTVYVGEEEHLMRRGFLATGVVWASIPPREELSVKARIRHRHTESDARVSPISNDEVLVEFREPQRAVTPGQAVVFYEGDRVLGGGWISEVLEH